MIPRALLFASFACALIVLVAASGAVAPRPQDQDAAKQEAAKQEKAREEFAKQEKAKEEKEAKERDKALKRAALERDLPIAREKLARAQRDLADQTVDAEAAGAKLQKELRLAQMRLETFEKREMPAKIAKGQLELMNAKDWLDNSKEELEQLELMYKDQDLADKTREIVIRRAKRDLDRSQQRLTLAEGDQSILAERTLPQEREKLGLDVEEKQREIARAERGAQKAMMEKKIAVMAAESEIKRIEAETSSLKGDAK